MRTRLLSLITCLGILVVTAIWHSRRDGTESKSANFEESNGRLELGGRNPAGKEFQHEIISTKIKKFSNSKLEKEISKTEPEYLDRPVLKNGSTTASSVMKVSRPTPAPGNSVTKNQVPQEFINFTQAFSPNSSPSSGRTIFISNVGASLPLSSGAKVPAPSEESGSRSTGVKQIILKGKVVPLVGVITTKSFNPFKSFEAYAAASCTEPKVGIFKTEDLLKLGVAPIQEFKLGTKAEFEFIPDPSINLTRPQDYSLQILNCDEFYSRIITEFAQGQDINLSSTLLSFTQVAPADEPTSGLSESDFATLSNQLSNKENEFSSILDVFNELENTYNESFESLFSSSPEILKHSLPVIRQIEVPETITEGVASTFKVDGVHWYPGYQLTAEWFINGVSTGIGTNWNWTPAGNSQRIITIQVRIGEKKDLVDAVDTAQPYHQLSFTRNVINAITPTPPALNLALTVPDISGSPLIPLKIVTGVDLGGGLFNFCSSFNDMAITEAPISPDESEFNLICSTENFQDYTYSLATFNRNDGPKTLYLWAKDNGGDISSTPSIVNFYLDQTAPVIGLPALNAVYGGNSTFTINWNITEYSTDATLFQTVEFFNGTSWTVLPSIPSRSGPLDEESFSTTFVLPDGNVDNARFRISASDLHGYNTKESSAAFNIRVAALTPTPLSYNFGDVIAQSESSSTIITFRNSGEWKTDACSTPVLSGDSAQFSIVSENCSSALLNAGTGTCQVEVRANPALRQAYNSDLSLTCGTKSSVVSLTVTGDNNPPTLVTSASYNASEDVDSNFTLTAGGDLDGDSLTYFIVSAPTNGVISNCLGGANDLSCTYKSNLNYNGTDSFTYRAFDGQNYSPAQSITINVTPVNDAPTLTTTQSGSINEDLTKNITLNPGSDIENDSLTYSVVSTTTSGSLSCSGGTSRSCTYIPNLNFNGTDSFTYKVNDGNLDSNLATYTITVNPINDAPVAASDFSQSVNEEGVLSFTLAAGTDIDLPADTLTYQLMSSPAHGTLTNCIESGPSSDLSCTYTPVTDFNGTDTLSYKVCDPFTCSTGVTTLTITVNQKNDLPVMIANETYNLFDTQFVNFNLSGATDIDLPAQTLSYQVSSPLSQGSLTDCIDSSSWSSDKSCTFTPPLNFQGTLSFSYKASDSEDESATASTITFNVTDKTPSPSPDITLASAYYTNSTSVTLTNTSCSDISHLYISVVSSTPTSGAAGWELCNTTAGGYTTTIGAVNGQNTVYIWSKDSRGNVQPIPDTVNVVFDNISPAITILNQVAYQPGSSVSIPWKVTEENSSTTLNFTARFYDGTTWNSLSTTSAANGAMSNVVFSKLVTIPSVSVSNLLFEVSFTDLAGNAKTVVSNAFSSDDIAPIISSIVLNNGAASTDSNSLTVDITGNDNESVVAHFCLKENDSSTPVASDSCWNAVDAPVPGLPLSATLNLNDFNFLIGFVPGVYEIHAWVKDAAGNISTGLSDTIEFIPSSPPEIQGILATGNPAPTDPPALGDDTIAMTDPVYIKWKIVDDKPIPDGSIKIYYSLDGISFTNLVSSGLNNSSNGGCVVDDPTTTVDDVMSGCFTWTAPTNNLFYVRIEVTDSNNMYTFKKSTPLNSQRMKLLAGNSEDGLGASASAALFIDHNEVDTGENHALAVTSSGYFFFRDFLRGLLYVNPSTGILEKFIQETGVITDGPLTSATAKCITSINLDHQERLWIIDYDTIRMIDLNANPKTITTVIGGGASENDVLTNARDLAMYKSCAKNNDLIRKRVFDILPNGDIYFNAGQKDYRRYEASNGKIYRQNYTGTGSSVKVDTVIDKETSTTQWYQAAYSYDKTTSIINKVILSVGDSNYQSCGGCGAVNINPSTLTSEAPHPLSFTSYNYLSNLKAGMDGELYKLQYFNTRLYKFNRTTNNFDLILGKDSTGSCEDGTPATQCPLKLYSYFVNKNGRVFFTDSGRIRTIDSSGNVATIYGQSYSYGDGLRANAARFGEVSDVGIWKDGSVTKVVALDRDQARLREFATGGIINTIAGNGNNTQITNGSTGLNNPIYSKNQYEPERTYVHSTTGDVFIGQPSGVYQLERTLGTWKLILGGGSTLYSNAAFDDYANSLSASGAEYGWSPVGLTDGKLIVRANYYVSVAVGYQGGIHMELDYVNMKMRILAGQDVGNVGRVVCPLGTLPNSCAIGASSSVGSLRYFWDTSINSWTLRSGSYFYKVQHGSNIEYNSMSNSAGSSTMQVFVNDYPEPGKRRFFSCNSTYIREIDPGVANAYVDHTWPDSTITCTGRNMAFSRDRKSIILPVKQNGLSAIAEYLLP